MYFKLIISSVKHRLALYIPMLAVMAVSLCLIGAASLVSSNFDKILDKEMANYGANVILKSNSGISINDGNVPLRVQGEQIKGRKISVAEGSLASLLKMNPAWLVKGSSRILAGSLVAPELGLKQGQTTTIGDVTGKVSILESGTDFDSYIFLDKKTEAPNMFLIRTNDPSKYRGMDAVVMEEMVRTKYAVLASIKRLMFFIALITAIASVAAVINLCRVDAGRRKREFGVFKSLGGSIKTIRKLLCSEFALLAITSFIAGFTASVLLSWGILNYAARASVSLSLQSVFITGATSIIAFSLAAMIFIFESKHVHAMEELRNE